MNYLIINQKTITFTITMDWESEDRNKTEDWRDLKHGHEERAERTQRNLMTERIKYFHVH